MAFQKRTLRRMKPEQKRLAGVYNEIEAGLKHLRKMIDSVGDLELDARAMRNRGEIRGMSPTPNPMILWPQCPRCGSDTVMDSEYIGCSTSTCVWGFPLLHQAEIEDDIGHANLLSVVERAKIMLELGIDKSAAVELLQEAMSL